MKTSHRATRAQSSPEAVQSSAIQSNHPVTDIRLYRLPDVLKRIPVSRSSWFAGIQVGRFPRGHHLGPRTTVWRSDDIDQVIANLTEVAA